MKRLVLIFAMVFCLCGCSSKQTTFTNNDFALSETNITSKGIMCGSTSEEFKTAYSDFVKTIGVMYSDDNSIKESTIDKIDYDKSCRVYLSAICIDDDCISTNDFIKQNKIKNGIDNWFSENTEYLDSHTAIYKCLIFTFENGNVYNIESYEKNYNDEK
ncbi:hypothetical protein DWW50_03495 [Eubacterium sp. AF15-50]|uniref:hypothetical protein n=1 Tax=unclassified Eubacterium (in: firmicutes) TaxID=2624479 RepID=UPI000E54FD96|nr:MULTISPECIES: hypothetical protein [unclassified Eubacterium (in: firmicutes)]RHR73571.1 hypothetical protein DWW68_03495 [Eubacterium sp. AF16-48]RHR81248.1 hypothetical protein DWW50_03495 [Eubacterium sp. AF15-50]